MIPYISIIIPVARVGGLDVLFSSLENQTFKDFELVLVDSLYKYRKDIVKEKAKEYTFLYKHIPPIKDNFPIQSYCHANNTGIVNCDGDIILFSSDYRYFMPDCLQKRANFHKIYDDNIGYATPTKSVVARGLKNNLPSYGDSYKNYINDLENSKLQQHMWSVYDNEFNKLSNDPSQWTQLDISTYGWDSKNSIQKGHEVSTDLIYLQCESIKTNIVLEANGLNEALDGSHLWQDWEFSHRLRNMFDFKWIGDGLDMSYRLTGGHEIIGRLQHTRPSGSNEPIFNKYKNGSIDPVNDWNLKDMHKFLHKGKE